MLQKAKDNLNNSAPSPDLFMGASDPLLDRNEGSSTQLVAVMVPLSHECEHQT